MAFGQAPMEIESLVMEFRNGIIYIRDLTFFISYPIILSSVAIRQDRRESENRNYPLWMSLAFANFFAKRTIE